MFVDERLINKAQLNAGFDTERSSDPLSSIKDPGHDSELQAVSETA